MPPNYPPRKKQNTFFVDTKSTCFLCLEEIPPDPPPISKIMLDECDDDDAVKLKLTGQAQMKGKTTEKQEPFCLRSIFKLLQLDTGKVLGKKLSAGPFLLPNLTNMDLTVVLCRRCLHVTTQLTSLYAEWQVLQMKLDHAIRSFSEILRNSEEDPNKLAQLRKMFLDVDPLDMLQGSIAEQMRKDTLDKCNRHLQIRSWPKVNLSRASKVVDSEMATSAAAHSSADLVTPISSTTKKITQDEVNRSAAEFTCYLCSRTCSTFQKLSSHMRSRHQVSATSLPTQKLLSSSQLPKATCKACGMRFKIKDSLTRHKRLYCKFRSAAPVTAQVMQHPIPAVKYTCSACGNSFKQKTSIYRHRQLYCKFRFDAIKPDELLSSCPRIKMEDEDQVVLCGLCPSQNDTEKFRTKEQLEKHVFTHHPDYIFASIKLPDWSEDKFRELCAKMLEEDASQMEIKLDDIQDGVTFSCSNCAVKYVEKWSMVTHMVKDHCSIYASKLVDWQRSDRTTQSQEFTANGLSATFPCKLCNLSYKSGKGLRRHLKLYCPFRKTNQVSSGGRNVSASGLTVRKNTVDCEYCGKNLHKTSLFRHKKSYCELAMKAAAGTDFPPETSIDAMNVTDTYSNEEEVPLEVNQGSFTVGTTKIEVMEPSPLQFFTEQPFPLENVAMVVPEFQRMEVCSEALESGNDLLDFTSVDAVRLDGCVEGSMEKYFYDIDEDPLD